jgi:signal transduction histidine kinase
LNKGSVVSYRLAVENADLEFLAEEIPRAVAEVREGSEQVAKIVSALKDFSRPDSDIFGPVDLNGAIENTLAVTRSEWAEIAEIVLDLDTSLPEVPALPGPLKQGLLNIVVNAAQAVADNPESDGGRITVATSVVGDHAEIRVSDTGCGISSEITDRVFDPFFTTRDVGAGTGQGLSIAHSVIVDRHGGALSFTSEVGVGTTFVIRLPLERQEAAHPEPVPASAG